MKPKSVIIFYSHTRIAPDSIALPNCLGYVRAQEFEGDIEEALTFAQDFALAGEHVSNTHPAPE